VAASQQLARDQVPAIVEPAPGDPRRMAIAPFPRLADEGADTIAELIAVFHGALLPTVATSNSAVRCETRYRPGERRLSLGGDFLDVVDAPDGQLAFVIGDVSGHGPFAAAVALAMRASWRTLALGEPDLAVWLSRMEQVLGSLPRSDELFVTVCTGIIDIAGGRGSVVSAGHPPPVLLTDGATPIRMTPSPPLGVAPTPSHELVLSRFEVADDWGLLAYTDGLIEGRIEPGSPERYGAESLAAWLSMHRPSQLDRAGLDALIAHAEAANGGPADDDVAILLLTRQA
jgi:serine phosphatase RsbU (regulator of sigma subunit)